MAEPTIAELVPLQDLYDRGRFLQAYRESCRFGPLSAWRSAAGRVLAGRLLVALGARRAAQAVHYRAFRENPHHAQACVFAAHQTFQRFGPYAAWAFLDRHESQISAWTAQDRCDVEALRAQVASGLRDFVLAEKHFRLAEEAVPGTAWVAAIQATHRADQGEHEAALQLAQQCLERHPWYVPATHIAAERLTYLRRGEEACALLQAALQAVEAAALAQFLTLLHREANRLEAALEALRAAEALSPCAERDLRNWHRATRAQLLYQQGNYPAAVAEARALALRPHDTEAREYFDGFTQRLLQPDFRPRRHQLDVPFIPQDYDTCAPTTMAMLCTYWGQPVDHRQIAAEICYGGTPSFRQRQWALDHGWLAREFTLSEAAAGTLLDRGVPFAVTTVDPGAGHLMAVVGYDTGRQSILLRDPRQPLLTECHLVEFQQSYAAFGPTCLVILPPGEASRLAGVDLPDAKIYDELFQFSCALEARDRGAAVRLLEGLQQTAPEHRLTLHARLWLAYHDSNPLQALQAVDALLQQYPDSMVLKLSRWQSLRDVERPARRRQYIEELAAQRRSHPLAWSGLATELSGDARQRARCQQLLRRALRANPGEAQNFHALGNLYWSGSRHREARQLYRFAACLRETDEGLVRSYFLAARHLRQTAEAVDDLRQRFARYGRQSAGPALSLFTAYCWLERTDEGFAVLEEAIALRPQDPDLLLNAAARYSEYGRQQRAAELLEQARPCCEPLAHVRTAAHLAMSRFDLVQAAALWKEVVCQAPFDLEALTHAARLIGQTESPQAAAAFLEEQATRYPHNRALAQLWYGWTPDEEFAQREKILQSQLSDNPDDVWALQRQALLYLDQQRIDAAQGAAQTATQLAPEAPEQPWILGLVREAQNRLEDARRCFAASLQAQVDFEPAIDGLMRCSPTDEARRASLETIEHELIAQTMYGDGLLCYWSYARTVLAPEALERSLEAALAARPDLWQAHSAVIRHLLHAQQPERALAAAQAAVERFPLVPALWLNLALVHRMQGDQEQELAALRAALGVNPGWWEAIAVELCVYERTNDMESARRVLEQAQRCNPLRPEPQVALAELALVQQQREECLGCLRRAMDCDPHRDETWDCLVRWAQQFEQPAVPVEFARELVVRRPGEAAAHFRLASLLVAADAVEERLVCLRRALELSPRYSAAYELQAETLAERGRFAEALDSLRTDAWGPRPPDRVRLVAATLHLMQGYIGRAQEVVDAVLADEPRSIAAWVKRAQCHEHQGDPAAAVAAYQAAYDIDPSNVVLAAMLAASHINHRDFDAARRLLLQAIYVAPTYLSARLSLLDVLLEQRAIGELERLVVSMRTHFPPEFAFSAEAQLAALLNDRERALYCLDQMLALPHPNVNVFPPAMDRLVRNAEWNLLVEERLLTALRQPGGHPQAAELWVRWYAAESSTQHCCNTLATVAGADDVRRRALVAYCGVYLRRPPPQSPDAQQIVNRFRALFLSSNEAWAWAGRILNFDNRNSDVVAWMHDWRARSPAEAWMLLPLATSYFEQGLLGAACQVSRQALQLAPDDSVSVHQTIVAWHEAQTLAGAADAAARLRGMRTDLLWPLYQLLHDFTASVASVAAATPRTRSATARQAARHINATWKQWKFPQDRRAIAIRRQALQLVRQQMGWMDYLLSFPSPRTSFSFAWIPIIVLIALQGVALVLSNLERTSSPKPNRPSVPASSPPTIPSEYFNDPPRWPRPSPPERRPLPMRPMHPPSSTVPFPHAPQSGDLPTLRLKDDSP